MSSESARDAVEPDTLRNDLEATHRLLWAVYGLFPIVAGIDKFANFLVEWTALLPGEIANALPIGPELTMYVVGVVEIAAGILVLVRTEYGAYLVAAWLVAVAAVQVVAGNFDVAVRDVWIAVGAIALAQLTVALRGSSRPSE